MKRILITGTNSYIGTSFEKWVSQWPDQYQVDTVDMIGDSWREKPFSGYDTVFHVAGIAHVSTDPKLKDLYFKVNRDLANETAKKAKAEGVSQFVFMSSIIVYGDSAPIGKKKIITRDTVPEPANFYGQSKLEAEQGILALDDEHFRVVILRPPMIYGKGCKGNYPKLAKIAKLFPVFPSINNERSILYIGNLCEFIRLLIDRVERGTFFPQNVSYVKTSELVQAIAKVHGRKIVCFKGLSWLLKIMCKTVSMVNKAFGSDCYAMEASEYPVNYRIFSFVESIIRSEEQ